MNLEMWRYITDSRFKVRTYPCKCGCTTFALLWFLRMYVGSRYHHINTWPPCFSSSSLKVTDIINNHVNNLHSQKPYIQSRLLKRTIKRKKQYNTEREKMAAKAVVCYGSSTSSTTLRPVLCPQQLNKRSFFSSVFALLWPELCFLLLFIILLLHVGGGFSQWILGDVASISITKVWAFGTFKCVVNYWKLEII